MSQQQQQKKVNAALPLNRIKPRQSSLVNPASLFDSYSPGKGTNVSPGSPSAAAAGQLDYKGKPSNIQTSYSHLQFAGNTTSASSTNPLSASSIESNQKSPALSESNSLPSPRLVDSYAFSSPNQLSSPEYRQGAKSQSSPLARHDYSQRDYSNANYGKQPNSASSGFSEASSSYQPKKYQESTKMASPYSASIQSPATGGSKLKDAISYPSDELDEPEEKDYDEKRPRSRNIPSFTPSVASDSTTNSKGRSMQALLKNLETRNQAELVAIAKKMVSEINIKNRIINESKTNEKWLVAQLLVSKDKAIENDTAPSDLQAKINKASSSVQDKEFLQTLMAFKGEINTAKKRLEEHEATIIILQKKKSVAEEENKYLKKLNDPNIRDTSGVLNDRVRQLEAELEDTVESYSTLQTKVSQWTRASKRHQEGRIAAESVQKILEDENEELKTKLETCLVNEKALRSQLDEVATTVRSKGSGNRDSQLVSLDAMLAASKAHVDQLEAKLERAENDFDKIEKEYIDELDELEKKHVDLMEEMEKVKLRNQELENSVGSKNAYDDIIRKRASAVFENTSSPAKDISTTSSPKNVDSSIHRELAFLKEKYGYLEEENQGLMEAEHNLQTRYDALAKEHEKILATLEDQEELQLNIKQMVTDKKSLEDAYNIALDKIQQKNLAIEMLQKNVDRTRERMEPLQKSAEVVDDLQEALGEERYKREELEDRLEVLEEDNKAQQAKIISLMEQLDSQSPNDFQIHPEEVEDLKEAIEEYKQMNEILALQLEEKSQDVKFLEARLNEGKPNSALNTATTVRSLPEPSPDMPEDMPQSYEEMSNELMKATANLAEQMVTIGQLEQLVNEDNETIEKLQSEKSKLTQKLNLMQHMKAEFDNQTGSYEKLVARSKELELQLSNTPASSDLQEKYEEELSKLKKELYNSKSQEEDLQAQLNELNDELKSMQKLQDQKSELEIKIIELTEEKKLLLDQLEHAEFAEAEHDENLSRIQQLEDSLSTFAQQKEQFNVQLQYYKEMELDYQEEVDVRKDLEFKLSQVDQEVEFLQTEFDKKIQEVQILEEKIKDMDKLHKANMDKLEQDYQSAILEVQSLEEKIKELEGQNASSRRNVEDNEYLQVEFDKKVQEVQFLQDSIRETEEMYSEKIGQLEDNHREAIDKHMEKISKLEKEQSQMTIGDKQERGMPESLFSRSQDDLTNLLNQLDKAEMEIEDLKTQIAEKDAILQESLSKSPPSPNVAKAIPVEDEKLVDLHYMLAMHEKELKEKDDEIDKLLTEVDQLEERLVQVSDEKNELERETQRIDIAWKEKNELLLAEKHSEIKRLESMLDSLNDRLKDSAADEKEMEGEIVKLQSHIADLELQSSTASNVPDETKSEDMKAHILNLQDEIEEKERLISGLKDEIQTLNQKVKFEIESSEKALQAEMDEKESTIEHLQQSVSKANSQIQDLTMYIAEIESATKQSNSNSNHEELDLLLKEVEEKNQLIKKLENEIVQRESKYKFDVDSLGIELKEMVALLEKEVEEKSLSIKRLEDEILLKDRKYQSEVETLGLEMKEAVSQKDSLIEDLQNQINSINSKLANETDPSSTDVTNSLELEKKVKGLTVFVEEYRAANGKLKAQVEKLESSLSEMQQQLQYHADIANDAIKQVEEYEDQLISLKKGEGQVDQEKFNNLQNLLKSREKELAELKANSASSALNVKLDEAHLLNDQLMAKIAALSQKIAQTDNRRLSANPNLMNASKELVEVKAQLDQAIAKINTFQHEKASLMDELDDLRDHNMVLMDKLSNGAGAGDEQQNNQSTYAAWFGE